MIKNEVDNSDPIPRLRQTLKAIRVLEKKTRLERLKANNSFLSLNSSARSMRDLLKKDKEKSKREYLLALIRQNTLRIDILQKADKQAKESDAEISQIRGQIKDKELSRGLENAIISAETQIKENEKKLREVKDKMSSEIKMLRSSIHENSAVVLMNSSMSSFRSQSTLKSYKKLPKVKPKKSGKITKKKTPDSQFEYKKGTLFQYD